MLLMVLIPDAIDLVTTTVLNTEIGKVGKKNSRSQWFNDNCCFEHKN